MGDVTTDLFMLIGGATGTIFLNDVGDRMADMWLYDMTDDDRFVTIGRLQSFIDTEQQIATGDGRMRRQAGASGTRVSNNIADA